MTKKHYVIQTILWLPVKITWDIHSDTALEARQLALQETRKHPNLYPKIPVRTTLLSCKRKKDPSKTN